MAIDVEKALALELPAVHFEVERGRLRFFAAATGQTDPIYTDVAAARAAGHRDLPVPPTFYFSMELDTPDMFEAIASLGVDLRFVLHGEQGFDYHSMACAGDSLTLTPRFTDVVSKKGGALELLTKQTDISRGHELIASATNVIVVRNPGVGS